MLNFRSLIRMAVVATALTATLASGAQAAPEAPTERAASEDVGVLATERYRSKYTQLCLTQFTPWLRVTSATCDSGNSAQQWTITVWADGTRRFRNVLTGECMKDDGGARIVGDDCDSSRAQSWYVRRFSDGSIWFKNQYYGWCITDTVESGLVMRECSTHESRRWY